MTDSAQDPDPAAPYYFESDHAALKDNPDYCKLLHTIAVLEAQRHKATQDLEALYQAQDQALADPLKFVEKLQKGEAMDFPRPQKMAELPEIQWEKYTSTTSFSSFGSNLHKTRQKRSQESSSKGDVQKLKSSLMGISSNTSAPRNNDSATNSDVIVVRGRAKDNSKPASFNQLWSAEEQHRLESLLVTFPPEEVEARRWAKIAKALGNRTPIQVASRVQKYFLTLAKEGLPVPGRMPNMNAHSKRGTHRHHRFNRNYYPSSTMLQSHTPPVLMAEDVYEREGSQTQLPNLSDSLGGQFSPMIPSTSRKDILGEENAMFEGLTDLPEYKELLDLQKLKEEKLQEDNVVAVQHIGYKCDNCLTEPICGTRWHCIDCVSGEVSYDFCDGCSVLPFQDGKHDSTHRLQPIKNNILDSDYISYSKPSYLDSNYMPSS